MAWRHNKNYSRRKSNIIHFSLDWSDVWLWDIILLFCHESLFLYRSQWDNTVLDIGDTIAFVLDWSDALFYKSPPIKSLREKSNMILGIILRLSYLCPSFICMFYNSNQIYAPPPSHERVPSHGTVPDFLFFFAGTIVLQHVQVIDDAVIMHTASAMSCIGLGTRVVHSIANAVARSTMSATNTRASVFPGRFVVNRRHLVGDNVWTGGNLARWSTYSKQPPNSWSLDEDPAPAALNAYPSTNTWTFSGDTPWRRHSVCMSDSRVCTMYVYRTTSACVLSGILVCMRMRGSLYTAVPSPWRCAKATNNHCPNVAVTGSSGVECVHMAIAGERSDKSIATCAIICSLITLKKSPTSCVPLLRRQKNRFFLCSCDWFDISHDWGLRIVKSKQS